MPSVVGKMTKGAVFPTIVDTDDTTTAAAAEIAGVQAAGVGAANSFARSDHAHQIQHGIADNHLVTIDAADVADNDYAKFTANGLEGREASEVISDLGLAATYQGLDATLTALAALVITEGSLITGTGADAFSMLAKGTTLQALCMNVGATAPEWVAVTGTGSVVRATSPTIVTPTIASFTGAGHTHADVLGAATTNGGLLAAKLRTVTKILYIDTPLATDIFPICMVPNDSTMIRVEGATDVGTVTFNIERRSVTQVNGAKSTGTDVLTANLVADATAEATTTFDNSGDITGDQWLVYVADAVATAPTLCWISIEYTVK